ncbi:MAG: recombinase family protein [Oceanicaulis sp.]
MKIGYANLFADDTDIEAQLDALTAAGCRTVFKEAAPGGLQSRPELKRALAKVQRGDVLVVWRLERLAGSLRELNRIIARLHKTGVGFIALEDGIDTTTPAGPLVYRLFSTLEAFERDAHRERTKAGVDAARARGRKLGRPNALTEAQIKSAGAKRAAGTPVPEIAEELGVSRATLYRKLGAAQVPGRRPNAKRIHEERTRP